MSLADELLADLDEVGGEVDEEEGVQVCRLSGIFSGGQSSWLLVE